MTFHRLHEHPRRFILAGIFRSSALFSLLLLMWPGTILPQEHGPTKPTQIFPEHSARDEWQKPVEILEALNIKSGDAVADIGSGAGYFTGWLSQAAGPQGRVFAVDISEEAIRLLQSKIEFYPIKNIVTVLCTQNDLKLAPHSLDLAFILNTFSVVHHKETMLTNVMASLKPRGRLTIIDWRARPSDSLGPPKAERLSEEQVIKMGQLAGFRLVKKHHMLPSQYFLEFVRDERHPETSTKQPEKKN
jgi:arsenite methyltransferase